MMIIKHHWKTFRNTFRDDVPQQILRAVILEALQQACDEDDALVSIVWLTGRSYLPYMQQGSEYDLCTHFLHGLGERAESNATSMWSDADSLSSMETAVAPQFALPEIDVTALDKDELVQQVTAAASPGTNPYTVAQNASAWSAHFGQAVASNIANALDLIPTNVVDSIAEALNQAVPAYLSSLLNPETTVNERFATRSRRINLLWWKETLYSSTLGKGYRGIDPATAAIVMACDLHQQSPLYHPESLEYLLRETVRDVGSTDAPRVVLIDACTSFPQVNEASFLAEQLGGGPTKNGRVALLAFLQSLFDSKSSTAEDMQRAIGVAVDTAITLQDLAVWVYRDLQAQQLATTSTVAQTL